MQRRVHTAYDNGITVQAVVQTLPSRVYPERTKRCSGLVYETRRSPEVALTPNARLAVRSTDKPARLRDGCAESTWDTTAKGLDVQLRGPATRR